jgi:hypothetical protein
LVAVNAAVELGRRAGRPTASSTGPIPLGIGVNTGEAYVGATGPAGAVDDFTALGDIVNTTAGLASTAAAGRSSSASPQQRPLNARSTGSNAAASWSGDATRRSTSWSSGSDHASGVLDGTKRLLASSQVAL